MATEKVVQSLWIGDRLSPVEQLCIRSFLFHGFAFHLYCYGTIGGVPDGTTILAADDIIPRREIFTVDGRVTLFSDYFRFMLLWERGGTWVDMDLVCLKNAIPEGEVVLSREDNDNLAIGYLRFPPEHELVRIMLDRGSDPPKKHLVLNKWLAMLPRRIQNACKSVLKAWIRLTSRSRSGLVHRFSRNSEWGAVLGPVALTASFRAWGGDAVIIPPAEIYPVPFRQWRSIYEAGSETRFNLGSSTFVHLWNEMSARDGNFNKFETPQEGSLFAALCTKYGVHVD